LLGGSFAADFKRDGFSALDLFCVCSETLNEATIAALIERLAPVEHGGPTCCQFLNMGGGITVDLCFVGRENQERYFHQLDNEGRELPFVKFDYEEFAASTYHWSKGTILSDSDGILASFQNETRKFPPALQHVINKHWTLVWQCYCADFRTAYQQRDRIRALTAISLCSEAALRVFLAENYIYCNPIEPKWLSVEIANLPEEIRQNMKGVEYIASDISESLLERFEKMEKLWALYRS
jgi:hypothetical protein